MDSLKNHTTNFAVKEEDNVDPNHLATLVDIFAGFGIDRNANLLMQKLLYLAIDASSCEGGSIYTVTNRNTLQFQHFINNALLQDGESEDSLSSPGRIEIPLLDAIGTPDHTHLCSYVYHQKKVLHIEDAYTHKVFECEGIKRFDEKNGYRTQSVLTVPIFANDKGVIGVLQLINARHPRTGFHMPFPVDTQKFMGALAAICGFQMDNLQLIDQLNTQIHINNYIALEKERMLRDLHDGLGSQLTKASIGMQNGIYSPAESIKLIDAAIEEMNHIFENYLNFELSLHKMMVLTIHQYSDLFKSQKECSISYHSIGAEETSALYPKDLVVNLMQVVREILTNSLKYSSAKKLEIILSANDDHIKLSISENDLGEVTPTLPAFQSRGFGQKNMLHRIESALNGSILFSKLANSHLIEISIPNIVPDASFTKHQIKA
ncbi:GAF domain-containing protein [Polynucleobacter sp. JS-Fieb-80-E5]|uniref:GAF domain-containing sensor histidine kinase n=1 Tax=Polynucleobacter sp. JS-Fieb-80-E5 TaxID=2081050 RepID=UPI001C0B8E16|nr:GAF domain-containing protein [Polynucleobacter sp. JS-Fieb-80-E5]MBU3617847.1 GAF domain-containing protein [Polynucleobacter sp. JS-Fieb-80-E5]